MKIGNNAEKIVGFSDVQKYRRRQESLRESDLEKFDEMVEKVREFIVANMDDSTNLADKRRIMELEEENRNMKRRLKNAFPSHIVFCTCIFSLSVGCSLTLLLLRYLFHVYTIDPYYIIVLLMGSLTLLTTALASITDWKEYLNGRK